MDETMEAVKALYQAHAPALLSYLRRRFGGGLAPHDVLQETFLQVVMRYDRLAEVASPRAWLFAISRNVALRMLRKRHPAATLPTDVADAEPDEPDPRLADMRRAIVSLSQAKREAIELRLRHGMSYEEIATVLDVPVGTVRSRLHRAVLDLREAMSRCQRRKVN